jgi:hypothetical protein
MANMDQPGDQRDCPCAKFPRLVASRATQAQDQNRWTGWEWEEIVQSIGSLHETSRVALNYDEKWIFFQCQNCQQVWRLQVNFFVPDMCAN